MHRDEIHWDDLRYLRAALHARSLAGAARQLRVEHTTIGRRLTALERALGVALVVRGTSGLAPTAIGADVAPLVDDLERTVAAIRALVDARRRHVRLATPSGFAPLFTTHIGKLRARDATVSLELVSGAKPVDLAAGDADLALRVGPINDASLVRKKLGEVGWGLYASPDYLARAGSVDPDALSGHDVIGFEDSLARSPAAQWLDARAATARIVLRSREMVDMRDAALAGIGVAVLPCVLGDGATLVRITREPIARRPIALVYRRDAKLSAAIRNVIAFVTEVISLAAL
jgi:DNA-binding transcriptional LysR family regulator